MTKKYRLLIESPQPLNVIQNEDGFTLNYGDVPANSITVSMDSGQLIEEPKQSFKKWRAEKEREYNHVDDAGYIISMTEEGDDIDNYCYLTGNYFQTEQEAMNYKKLQEAIGRVSHAIYEANEGWKPDGQEDRWIIDTNEDNSIVSVDWVRYGFHTTFLPFCKTKEIALSIIKSHKEDLDLIFNLK